MNLHFGWVALSMARALGSGRTIIALTGWSLILVSLVSLVVGLESSRIRGQEPWAPGADAGAREAACRHSCRADTLWAEGTARDLLRNQILGLRVWGNGFPELVVRQSSKS